MVRLTVALLLAAVAAAPSALASVPSTPPTTNHGPDLAALEPGVFVRAHYYLEHYLEAFGVIPLDRVVFHPKLDPHIDRSLPILDTCTSPQERTRAESAVERYSGWLDYLLNEARYTSLYGEGEGDGEVELRQGHEPATWPTTYVAFADPVMHYGAYAARDIRAGEVLDLYAGIVYNNSRNNDYAWQYNWEANTVDRKGNTLWLVVDALHHGNAMRFVNHGDKHLLNVDQVYVPREADRMWYTLYVAKKDIPQHSQLFVSYGESYWATRPEAGVV